MATFHQCERDVIGYGPNPPKVNWPNNARIAVSFVVNYEEGGEYCTLEGDSHSESYLTEIVGTQPMENKRNLVAESCYEYGSRVGIYRIINLFRKYNLNFTTFAVGQALEKNPQIGEILLENGHELASHDYRWIDYSILPRNEEKDHLKKVVSIHKRYYNDKLRGIYVGRFGMHSKEIIQEVGGFEWCSDSYNDDIPYYYYFKNENKNIFQKNQLLKTLGTRLKGQKKLQEYYKPLLMLPYALDTNDFRFLTLGGAYVTNEQFYQYLKDSFDVKYQEGGKMMSIGLHSRISGHAGRIGGVEKFLQYITQPKFKDKVWVAKRIDIARFWRKYYPPTMKWTLDEHLAASIGSLE